MKRRVVLFVVSLVATLGSLFYSEVMFFQPCKLCWLQRIAMYPLVIISALNLKFKDGVKYMLPLSVIGFVISSFHVALERSWFGLSETSCSDSLCSIVWVNYFGFITIPLMAWTAFLLIIIFSCSLLCKDKLRQKKESP